MVKSQLINSPREKNILKRFFPAVIPVRGCIFNPETREMEKNTPNGLLLMKKRRDRLQRGISKLAPASLHTNRTGNRLEIALDCRIKYALTEKVRAGKYECVQARLLLETTGSQ